ncbi:galactose-3-o-sulfotransferase 3 [Plakobranchus ocellatus]|uniref:Galactose-3-o-sulfotransferase 3 n=1 Tax=Plakobranchus ocellatus TaxID=259542 RepID=A0AAV4B1F2_9GAST|nr:galactose-3-o-sulfotransferase 3 [Plakobranchus ocellatus]
MVDFLIAESVVAILKVTECLANEDRRKDESCLAVRLLVSARHFTMLRLVRKRKGACLLLVTTLLALTLLLSSQTTVDEQSAKLIASDLSHLNSNRHLDRRKPNSEPEPVVGQLSYLGQVISDSVAWKKPNCSAVINVAFVKTHKAGSSTIANILQRFGISRNLTFALPNMKYRQYGYNYISKAGESFTPEKLIPLKNGSRRGYNILCNHAIYNRSAFRRVMPANTHYISILREPFAQFVSAFEYYGAREVFSKRNKEILTAKNPISSYLQNPYKYEQRVIHFSYWKNKQAEDLGLGWNEFLMADKLSQYLKDLDIDFTLIMIMEYFDESLLLLKRKFCWELKDILYIPKNRNKRKPHRNFTDVDYKRHKSINHLDYALYAHYLKLLDKELQKQDKDFFEELAHFKDLLKKVTHSCNAGTSFYTAGTRWHDDLAISKRDCYLMLMSELKGLDILLENAGAFDKNRGVNRQQIDSAKELRPSSLRLSSGKGLPPGGVQSQLAAHKQKGGEGEGVKAL